MQELIAHLIRERSYLLLNNRWRTLCCLTGHWSFCGTWRRKMDGLGGHTWTGLCVAECLLSVQAKADIPSIRWRRVGAGACSHVMPSSTRRWALWPRWPTRPASIHWKDREYCIFPSWCVTWHNLAHLSHMSWYARKA